jgi:hypothetical protein
MELFLGALPLVGCAVMMMLCHRRASRPGGCASTPQSSEVADLRAEIAALRAEQSSTVGGRR